MINLLQSVPSKLQLISSAAATLDVVPAWADLNADGSGDPTMGGIPVAITTATTTDIVPTPAAGKVRNVKELHVRNKHATLACDVTIVFNNNATQYEIHKATIAAGEALEYVEGLGWFKITNRLTPPAPNFSTAAQAPAAATLTQITGSSIAVPATKLRIGSIYECEFDLTKTGAGTALSTYAIRIGTNNTTADASICAFTKPAGTAAADVGKIKIIGIVRGPLSASCIMSGVFELTHTGGAAGITGHSVNVSNIVSTISGTWDVTVANLFISVSITSGASDALTIQNVKSCGLNM